jgi:hypothetical protein
MKILDNSVAIMMGTEAAIQNGCNATVLVEIAVA